MFSLFLLILTLLISVIVIDLIEYDEKNDQIYNDHVMGINIQMIWDDESIYLNDSECFHVFVYYYSSNYYHIKVCKKLWIWYI